jgi:hypothetical protein
MTEKAITQAWLVIAALLVAFVIVAVRAPKAHCHDGTCHAHVGQ